MGFNFAIGSLADTSLDDLAVLGITPTGATTSGDLALDEGAPHVAVRDGQLVFACLGPELLDLVQEVAKARGVRGVTVVFASTADVHVLWIGEGERERMLVMENGEVVDTVGAPWPEEEAAFADEEFEADALAVTFARLTGVELLDERWLEGTFHELDCGSLADNGPEAAVDLEPGTDQTIEVDRGMLDAMAVVQRAGAVVMGLLGLAVVAELVFTVLAVARDESFGVPLPHLVFAVLALLTVVSGRLDSGRLAWTAASAGVLVVSIIATGILRDHHVVVLSAYALYLAVVIGALVWHARQVKAVRAMLPG
ncbi:hypothetical protein [Nocardioides jensenii]|uniref:hypothetical protein n=1 Tax=Nocardioides jensenii TaxID=1843 RepID=UPI0008343074|nr:hypothetical protein [Nocardioides jensenii]